MVKTTNYALLSTVSTKSYNVIIKGSLNVTIIILPVLPDLLLRGHLKIYDANIIPVGEFVVSMVGELDLLQFSLDQLIKDLHDLRLMACVHILNTLEKFNIYDSEITHDIAIHVVAEG